MNLATAIRTVAMLEGAKGLLVLVAGVGAFSLMHHDARQVAESLVGHLHLNPAKEIPRIFLEFATRLTDMRLAILSILAGLYSGARLIEAYGLWWGKRWAEWFAIASGAIYVPFELYALLHEREIAAFLALVANLAIVALMVMALNRKNSGK